MAKIRDNSVVPTTQIWTKSWAIITPIISFSHAFLGQARHTIGKANKRHFKLLEAIENDTELGGVIQDE